MKFNFKHLGLVVAAVFAMSAFGATAASAAEFHSSVAPVTITGTQTTGHVFTTNGGTVTCKTATFSGTQSAKTTTTQTLTPTYSGCTAFGFVNVPIHMNGCAFIFSSAGTIAVECPPGAYIDITVPGCTIKISALHLATGNTFTTVGSTPNRSISAHTNASGITYDECGTVRTNGTYKGTTSIKSSSGEVWYT